MDKYAQLLTFVRVAEAGSFSAAARAYDFTPSAVSKAIGRLEDQLGVTLFSRTSRSLALTTEGEKYLHSAQVVIEAMREADSVGDSMAADPRGTLHIHTMLTFAKYQLAPLMPAFIDRYPNLRLEFQLGPQFMDLFEHGVDVAIHSGLLPDSTLISRRILSSRWILCASKDYLARFGIPSSYTDLASHRCLGFSISTPWNNWLASNQEGEKGVPLLSHASANQGELLLELARHGAGIVRLAEFHVGRDIREGRLVALPPQLQDFREEPIYAIYRNRRNLSPRIAVFIEFIQEYFRDNPLYSTK
jgi:DNA-binding transcriptional LysR family regulator